MPTSPEFSDFDKWAEGLHQQFAQEEADPGRRKQLIGFYFERYAFLFNQRERFSDQMNKRAHLLFERIMLNTHQSLNGLLPPDVVQRELSKLKNPKT